MAKRKSKPKPKPKPTSPALEPRRSPPQAAVRGVTASEEELVARAVKFGSTLASEILRPKVKRGLTRAAGDNGIIVAEGDSWFDYPFNDILEKLEDDFGFRVESVASKGDQIEDMAYNPAQGAALARVLNRLKDDGKTPRAILLSGGGNDMTGDQFGMLINHVSSGLPPLNTSIVSGIINERLMYAYGCVIGRINQMTQMLFAEHVPIVIHGYGYAVPDGRGFLGGQWFLPGPWLRPGFFQKGHTDPQLNIKRNRASHRRAERDAGEAADVSEHPEHHLPRPAGDPFERTGERCLQG